MNLSILALLLLTQTSAFTPTFTQPHVAKSQRANQHYSQGNRRATTDLHLFRRIFGRKDDDGKDDVDDSVIETSENATTLKEEVEAIPEIEESKKETKSLFFAKASSVIDKKEETAEEVTPTVPIPSPLKELSAKEKAESLQSQAERIRLEAEKMDIILTLEKISKLEKEMASKAVQEDKSRKEDIKKQILMLKKKLDVDKKVDESSEEKVENKLNGLEVNDINGAAKAAKEIDSIFGTTAANGERLSSSEIETRITTFNKAPLFMKQLVVQAANMNMENLNTTALILKLYEDEKQFNLVNGLVDDDLTESKEKIPEFSQEEIEVYTESVKMVPQFLKNVYDEDIRNNDTAIAIAMLEDEWRQGTYKVQPEMTREMIEKKVKDIQWIPKFLRGDNDTALAIELLKNDLSNGAPISPMEMKNFTVMKLDTSAENSKVEDSSKGTGLFGGFGEKVQKSDTEQMVESLFPESTRKEGEEIKEAQAILAMSEVLAKDNVWASSGPPEKVPGGYLVRGSTRFETGKELIEAIDANLVTSRVRNQIDIFYVFDPTPVSDEQMDNGERPPVLFITAPNVARDPEPLKRTFVSAIAFGTIWYSSLLPFLLNEKYMKMADEQIALADASMASNLDWLNDISFPLFAATIGIQAVHELGHFLAASGNGLNTTIPTLVPSIATGLTGGITALQNSPKDKQSLFDFAIAGPLAGFAVSASLLFAGMVATVSMDAASYADLPLLPLDLLRQSSLVGGIIDSISPGLLNVPDAALGTRAVSDINIPLHPLAIAGYFGMMINAVNLLPVGRTDGGRIALTLFGRSGTQLVSFLAYILMFVEGVMGSDLLLFFFSYVIFFQSELEIPQRNEVDDMDFSRVLLATATGVLVLLTLIPM